MRRLVRCVDWNGGEARLVAVGGTGFEAEFERDALLFHVAWDPREEGIDLRVDLRRWSRPPDAPMSDDDRRAVLDALWSFSADARGTMRSILVYDEETRVLVVQRWSRGDGGFLVRVRSDGVDYHELHRTLTIDGERVPGLDAEGLRVMRVRRPAQWAHPDGAQLDDVEWNRICANLERAGERDTFDSEVGWRVTCRA